MPVYKHRLSLRQYQRHHKHRVFFFYRFRVLHKDFGASHLVLVVIHVDGAEEVKHPLLFRSPPVGPRLSC